MADGSTCPPARGPTTSTWSPNEPAGRSTSDPALGPSLPAVDDRPIGVFDSGFGGLTVARALIDLLPSEDLVYVGDTGRYPYGPRPLGEVRQFAAQITELLVRGYDVKMVVVACNTAAAAALEALQDDYDIPLIGVIDPGIRAAVKAT